MLAIALRPLQTFETHSFVSPARKRRFAVMEGSISLVATLLPAIEAVDHVTIQPSAKSPIGRTVLEVCDCAWACVWSLSGVAGGLSAEPRTVRACLRTTHPPSLTRAYKPTPPPQPNIWRYTTGVWTKAYLRQQLLVALAGRAGEEVLFGPDELSSLNQGRIMFARQIAHKMLNAGMSAHPDFENIRTLGHNYMDESMEPQRCALSGNEMVGGGGGRGLRPWAGP